MERVQVRSSWLRTIIEQRRRLRRLLIQSPSLRPTVPAVLAESYPYVRKRASLETRLPLAMFPETCPWTPEQMLDAEFWPESERPPDRRMGFTA